MAANFYGTSSGSESTYIPTTGSVPYFVAEAVFKDALEKGEECPITFVPLTECEYVVMTGCFHLFENKAFSQCMRSSRDCPKCRKRVDFMLTLKK
jgi:hypothetical protein